MLKQNPFRFHEGLDGGHDPARRPGAQPAAAEPVDGDPPAGDVPRLRRARHAVRLRAWRRSGCGATTSGPGSPMPWVLFALGTLGTRHHAGRLLGLRDPRLGRLLGLGPGGERLAGAVARVPPPWPTACCCERGRKRFRRLNLVLAAVRLPAGRLRHLPDPLRRAGRLLGALVRRPRHLRLADLHHGASSWCSPSGSWPGAGAASRPRSATSRFCPAPCSWSSASSCWC